MTTNNVIKRAVIYCRVSTQDQILDGNSLVSQQQLCLEYAARHGYEIVEKFIEMGETAKTANRTQLQRLLKYCSDRKNKIDLVISYKIDRLARAFDDYSYMRVFLRRYGIKMKSITEEFDDSPVGRMMENIVASFAQFDNDVRTERSITGMKQAAREGRYVWRAPIGYKNVRLNGKATIAPALTAPLVARAFQDVVKGHEPAEEIRRQLVKKGLITQAGDPVSSSQFYTMLRNEVYTGCINKFGERHKGLFEAIISKEVFDAAQYVLNHRSKKALYYVKERPDFPLRRFIYSLTGAKLTGCWSQGRKKKYSYYFFQNGDGRFPTAKLEEEFKSLLNSVAMPKEELRILKSKLRAHFNKATADSDKQALTLKRDIKDFEETQRQLVHKGLKGIVSDTILQRELAELDEEIAKRHRTILTLPDKEENYEKLVAAIESYLLEPGTMWQKLKFPWNIKLQWFYFPNGVLWDGERFRTTKTCCLLRTGGRFWPPESGWVPLNLQNSNTAEIGKNVVNEGLNDIEKHSTSGNNELIQEISSELKELINLDSNSNRDDSNNVTS